MLASASAPSDRPTPTISAVSALISPAGIGRVGRSTASSSRSAQSLTAIPARYAIDDDATRAAPPAVVGSVLHAAPASTSPGTVTTEGRRTRRTSGEAALGVIARSLDLGEIALEDLDGAAEQALVHLVDDDARSDRVDQRDRELAAEML